MKLKKQLLCAVMLLVSATVFAQIKVTGVVKDSQGEPVIGATIRESGGSGGIVTDLDGKFTFNVKSDNSVMLVSYIGTTPQHIKVGNKRNFEIVLQEDNTSLGEVVVVGYGTQKKATLTGAVSVVNAKQFEDKGSLSSPLQAMQGTVPGVIITRSSGAPGDESWSMKLRGAVSANSTDPLVIVDGVEYSDGINGLRLLNSDDIESINFLKDASAAIYGSKAAGGVVLITTKKAKAGRTVVQYDGSFTGKVVGIQPKLMSLDQWSDAVETALSNDGSINQNWLTYVQLSRKYKNHYIDLSKSPNPFGSNGFTDVADFVFSDTNWWKMLWGNSWSTQHNVSVSGGNEKNLFRYSLGYLYDASTLKWGNNNNQRYNMRLDDVFSISKKMKLTSDIAYNRQDQVAPSQIGSVLSQSMPQPGLPVSTIDGRPYAWGTWVAPNWLAELGGDNRLKVSAIDISEQLNYKIYKDLEAVANLGYNTSTATRDIQNKSIDWYNYTGTKVVLTDPTQSNSSYENSFARTDYYMASGYLNWHHSVADMHNFDVMLGSQYNFTQYKYTNITVKDINPNLEVPNGSGTETVSGSKWHEAMMSYFGRINYDYKGKYLLTGNGRYDGSSKFQPKNRWQFFWGASAGWVVTEENFMRSLTPILNNLKLRFSYGVVGNQSGIDRYDGVQLYNVSSNSGALIGSGKVSTINTNGTIASTDRTWERIQNYNLGVDYGLFNNRLKGTMELFLKRNNNMLISAQYPGILGDKAPKTNQGKFQSKGWEGILNWSDKVGNVSYNIGGTVTYSTNKVMDIGTTSVLSSGFEGVQQGYPLNSYFGLIYMGKIQTAAELEKYTSYYKKGNAIGWNGTLRLGDNMFEDINGDGKLDSKDIAYLGSDDPKLSYSFNADVQWKGFDLSVIFQGVGRRTIFRNGNTWRIPMNAIYLNTTTQSIGKTWNPDHRNAYYPTYSNVKWLNNYNYQISSWSVENGAYLRLKNLTFGYTLPVGWLNRTRFISKLRIYLTGADIWEISHIHDGWDPEQSRTVSGLGRYPFNRTYTVGVDITF